MSGNERPLGSDLAFVDAYENRAADDKEIPELTDEDLARGWWEIGGVRVDEKRQGATSTERVELELWGDGLAAHRADGPGWRDRMAEPCARPSGRRLRTVLKPREARY